ncbi:hypothetical protein, partial [Pseudomonas aeruginosa]|uniref:hypothetical protein n=1 Tax=Pseudomonas aeruginosa TaxID=287 RepID=UPI003982F9C3
AGVLGVGEGHLLHRKALRVKSADFAKSGSLFQSFPKDPITHQFRVGVALSEPEADRREKGFLLQLQDRYRPVA